MNGLILVKKEKGWTSHDVVNRMRRLMNTKKVGHSGTLDPNVEGVLCIFINNATKCIPYVDDKTKEYHGTLKLGIATDSEDSDGEIIETRKVDLPLDEEKIKAIFADMVGESEQIPPMISSVKINGKKLYEYAREGKEVERKPRPITIYSLELVGIHEDEIEFVVNCSGGTYVRTLCVDIAKKYGTIGHMKNLVRTRVGVHRIENCNTLAEIEAGNYHVYSIMEALKGVPTFELDDEHIKKVKDGKRVKLHVDVDEILLTYKGEAIAIYDRAEGDIFASKRGLW